MIISDKRIDEAIKEHCGPVIYEQGGSKELLYIGQDTTAYDVRCAIKQALEEQHKAMTETQKWPGELSEWSIEYDNK